MQPDQPNNYWKQDPDEGSDKPTEMYAPTPVPDETPESVPTEPPIRPALRQPDSEKDLVHWSAVEYINGEKNGIWFAIFGVVVAALITVDILFLHAYTFSALVIVMAIAVIVFTFRPARNIDYTLSGSQGLYVGEKLYHFGDFKSFGLIKDHGQH